MQDRLVREQWKKRVERWKESGLSAKEFAAELGINARSLSWWRWQLSKGDAGAPKRRRPRRADVASKAIATPTSPAPMTFVEMTAAVVCEPIEIVSPSAWRVRIPSSFDDATLRRVLDVLEERR